MGIAGTCSDKLHAAAIVCIFLAMYEQSYLYMFGSTELYCSNYKVKVNPNVVELELAN